MDASDIEPPNEWDGYPAQPLNGVSEVGEGVAPPRTEVLLAGIDIDKQGAALRVARTTKGRRTRSMSTEHGLTACLQHLESTLRQPGPFLSEFRADSLGVKCCSHTLLLHAWVSVRRARSHPEPPSCSARLERKTMARAKMDYSCIKKVWKTRLKGSSA